LRRNGKRRRKGEHILRSPIHRKAKVALFRVQNALPIWHTHSTVTGSATALGLASTNGSDDAGPSDAKRARTKLEKQEEADRALAEHYRLLEEEEALEVASHQNGSRDVKPKAEVVYIKPEPDLVPVISKAEVPAEEDDMNEGVAYGEEKGPLFTGESSSISVLDVVVLNYRL
jgi:hypothetical protein